MKAYKLELLILDHDGLGDSGITSAIENAHYPNRCISPSVMKIESRDIGEWQDDNPLNFTSKKKAEYERLFSQQEAKEMWLLHLEGGGDEEYKLVPKVVWDWVFSPRPAALSTKSCAEDVIPPEVLDAMPGMQYARIMVTSGSCENDRAIMVRGQEFSTKAETLSWILDNNVELDGEWHGCLY